MKLLDLGSIGLCLGIGISERKWRIYHALKFRMLHARLCEIDNENVGGLMKM